MICSVAIINIAALGVIANPLRLSATAMDLRPNITTTSTSLSSSLQETTALLILTGVVVLLSQEWEMTRFPFVGQVK